MKPEGYIHGMPVKPAATGSGEGYDSKGRCLHIHANADCEQRMAKLRQFWTAALSSSPAPARESDHAGL